VHEMKFQDLGRGARIELAKMAKQLGMKFIGYNPTAQQVSLEYKGKGVTYHVDELVAQYQQTIETV
jgi:phosphoglycerate dehydrogenase-like enzyme